jgi:hypothetical protein
VSATSQAEEFEPFTVVGFHIAESGDDVEFAVRRTRVPGGWLLITSAYLDGDNGSSLAVASTFVPDESGTWLDTASE